VSIGEVGADDSLAVMAEYTAGGDKLHMAYSFNLLVPQCSSHYIRKQVEQFEARVKGGWASWSVGNHDVQRVASRWGGPEAPQAFAKLVLAMQLSLKGTPCLYQGDELAFAEADVPFELLQDPYGITFWPEFKGRDGCRTPIAWTGPTAASPPASRGCRYRRTTWPRRPRCRSRTRHRRWPSPAPSSPGAASTRNCCAARSPSSTRRTGAGAAPRSGR
jgi:glycosidase